jgi:hypothetical protein
VLVELLGDRGVDRRVAARPHVERLERRVHAQREPDEHDDGERNQDLAPAVALGQRAQTAGRCGDRGHARRF